MEKSKVNMVRTFVQQSKKHKRDFYKTVVDVVEEARRCYVEDGSVELDDMTEFTKMMFLDALVARDILLLENQLPFLVLWPLMNLRFGDEDCGLRGKDELYLKNRRGVPWNLEEL
ncbi:hypothetical protein DKX38_027982 [Salix brachista]|uniref:Uncharacterized protein n=1 Tax=Salix brachista TaxID=2182728 RepID=A0A5N5J6G8_9ROSI|nr:hypothetical protein DKX38_027982 [Salix brachista]